MICICMYSLGFNICSYQGKDGCGSLLLTNFFVHTYALAIVVAEMNDLQTHALWLYYTFNTLACPRYFATCDTKMRSIPCSSRMDDHNSGYDS